MFKKYWNAVKKPFWKTTKFSGITSLAIAVISVFIQVISWVTGDIGFVQGLENILKTYLVTFSLQMFLYTPWIFLYGGVKLFFEAMFPKEQPLPKEAENVQKETKKKPVSNDVVTLRKTAIQQTILHILEENKDLLDIEEIHVLERIHEEILTKTENYYQSLNEKAKKEYTQDILARFDELEQKVAEINDKVHRQKERQLDKQLEIIDQMTKD